MKMWYDYCQDTRTSRGEKRVDREEIFEYVKKQYGTIPEYCGAVLRIVQCFAIIMENGMR